jgi:hypothetical protein
VVETGGGLGYTLTMNAEVTPSNDTRPVPPEVVEMALRAVKEFPECFWFRHPDAVFTDWEDVDVIIDHLRRFGGHRAWAASKQLHLCR